MKRVKGEKGGKDENLLLTLFNYGYYTSNYSAPPQHKIVNSTR